MAMWRIKPADSEPPPQPEEYWREVSPEQAAELDLDEFAELNRRAEQEEARIAAGGLPDPVHPMRSPWFKSIIALLAVVSFFVLVCAQMMGDGMDFQLLKRSHQLAENQALADLRSAVVVIEQSGSSGTGFNISSDGLIVTNQHVVDNGGVITVTFMSGEQRVFTTREYTALDGVDLAVIDIDGADLPFVQMSAAQPQVGDELIFIGNPLGYDWTIGEVTMLGTVDIDSTSVYCLSGSIRPGASGSPVFNAAAEVAAVIFATSASSDDLGFAIPVEHIQTYLIQTGLIKEDLL